MGGKEGRVVGWTGLYRLGRRFVGLQTCCVQYGAGMGSCLRVTY